MIVDLLLGVLACVGMMLHCIVYLATKHKQLLWRIFAGLAAFGWFANAALPLGRLV